MSFEIMIWDDQIREWHQDGDWNTGGDSTRFWRRTEAVAACRHLQSEYPTSTWGYSDPDGDISTVGGGILATIRHNMDHDGLKSRVELYWHDGGIWSRYEDDGGEIVEEPTETGCTADEAEDTIEAAWGGGFWDLQWSDRPPDRELH